MKSSPATPAMWVLALLLPGYAHTQQELAPRGPRQVVSTQASAQSTSWDESITAGLQAYEQGRYAEADKFFLAALKEAENLGPEHPNVATSLNNLAGLYDAQAKYTEAQPLLKRSLAIAEKALGPEHPKLATGLENYAKLLRKTNREAEAAKMEARTKAIREKAGK